MLLVFFSWLFIPVFCSLFLSAIYLSIFCPFLHSFILFLGTDVFSIAHRHQILLSLSLPFYFILFFCLVIASFCLIFSNTKTHISFPPKDVGPGQKPPTNTTPVVHSPTAGKTPHLGPRPSAPKRFAVSAGADGRVKLRDASGSTVVVHSNGHANANTMLLWTSDMIIRKGRLAVFPDAVVWVEGAVKARRGCIVGVGLGFVLHAGSRGEGDGRRGISATRGAINSLQFLFSSRSCKETGRNLQHWTGL